MLIRDPNVVELARQGKIVGWSFGRYNVKDSLEPRANDLPLCRVHALDLDHISLIVKKRPAYLVTSVEVRAGAEVDFEIRAMGSSAPARKGP